MLCIYLKNFVKIFPKKGECVVISNFIFIQINEMFKFMYKCIVDSALKEAK